MKKGLVALLGATLLIASCGKANNNGKKSDPVDDRLAFTFDEAIEYYDALGITGVTLPDYRAAKEEAEYEVIEEWLEEYDMLEIRVLNSPRKEMTEFVSSLKKSGWKLEKDDNGDYEGYFKKNSYAEISVQDWTLATYDEEDNIYDCIRIFFEHAPIPGPEWPVEDLQRIFENNDADYFEIPALVSESALFYADEYLYYGVYVIGAMVVVSGATDDELDAYVETTLPGAGWDVTGDSEYGSATKAFVELDGVASIEFGMDEDEFLVVLEFGLSQLPLEEFSAQQIAAAFEELGLPAFTLVAPDYEGITFNYAFDDGNLDYLDNPNYCYDYLKINNMTLETFADYISKMEANGWSTTDTALPYNYYKHFEDLKLTAHIRVNHNIGSEEGAKGIVTITIYYISELDPLENWPAEEIATLLGENVTDVLPSADYQNSTYKMGKDKVTVLVADEYEDALVTNYKTVLAGAEFTYDEENNKYVSPNEQFFVMLSKDSDGNMVIEFHAFGFVSKNAQAWLDSRGLTEEAAPDFSSLEQYYKDGGNQTTCYKIWLSGDRTEAIKALLVGYTIPETPSEKWGYECFSASGLVEIDFRYDSEPNETVVWFYYYPDIA